MRQGDVISGPGLKLTEQGEVVKGDKVKGGGPPQTVLTTPLHILKIEPRLEVKGIAEMSDEVSS